MRETIRKFENEGLVRRYPRRGAGATSFTTSEIDDRYEIRLVLESGLDHASITHRAA